LLGPSRPDDLSSQDFCAAILRWLMGDRGRGLLLGSNKGATFMPTSSQVGIAEDSVASFYGEDAAG
jgi:hypothetical protein